MNRFYTDKKLCLTCIHRQVGVLGANLCTRRGIDYDPVLGHAYGLDNTYCAQERKPTHWYSRDRCGPEGKYHTTSRSEPHD